MYYSKQSNLCNNQKKKKLLESQVKKDYNINFLLGIYKNLLNIFYLSIYLYIYSIIFILSIVKRIFNEVHLLFMSFV
jgi:hypothetical protein